MTAELSERAQHLLRVLVERYIEEGQPIGSRTLSRDSGLQLSPATIRNVMSDLEEMGLVVSPHTSAGRIPTPAGFRLFVDSLIRVQPVSEDQILELTRRLERERASGQDLAANASSVLSGLTRMAGLVTVPRRSHSQFRQIEFLPLTNRRALAILVINETEVQNRILDLERDYRPEELQEAANFLNAEFSGKSIASVREALLGELRETRQDMNQMMLDAIRIAQQAVAPDPEAGFVMAGETNLMDFAELSDVEKLRELFDAFERKRDILNLLDRCLSAESLQIFIGEESGYKMLESVSVVATPYYVDDDVVGVLGVIGPTRMAYERVIPIVDITARLLGSALNSRD